jgi:hypothetical protein
VPVARAAHPRTALCALAVPEDFHLCHRVGN